MRNNIALLVAYSRLGIGEPVIFQPHHHHPPPPLTQLVKFLIIRCIAFNLSAVVFIVYWKKYIMPVVSSPGVVGITSILSLCLREIIRSSKGFVSNHDNIIYVSLKYSPYKDTPSRSTLYHTIKLII